MATIFDDARWPLLVVRYEGPMNDLEFSDYLSRFSEFIRRGRHITILDATSGYAPGLLQQRQQGQWMKEQRAVIVENNLGVAFVIISPALRFALSAILTVARMPGSHTVAATFGEAQGWCMQRLMRNGINVVPAQAH